ncbi:MAG: hypothetical protein P0Y53_18275 [Candidatus Pseudobacter hemicellulosilyticus]|uniref:Lipoprotein n=1 Tax=Candidatus Pseudobacter hemicellulosilyticus TaxID=3121375 RepID=A0AAJ5WPM0_9BACT|nr:MAG: hypothetical protein P0Y53_18275 [Pseudobacter sp.]
MKVTTLIAVAGLGIVMTACGGRQQKDAADAPAAEQTEEKSASLADAAKGLREISKASEKMGDFEAFQKKLAEAKPVSNDQLKSAIPAELLGIKRTSFSVGNQLYADLAMAESKFKGSDNKEVSLTIMDGAGEAGSALVSLQIFGLNMDMEKETEGGFEKTTDLKGYRAKVEQKKSYDQINSEIVFIVNQRFAVTLRGEGIELSELEKAMDQLNFSSLK